MDPVQTSMGIGEGIVGVGLWLFLAAVIVAGTWQKVARRREAGEIIRTAIEKGQPLDDEMIRRLLGEKDKKKDSDEEKENFFLIAGCIFLVCGIGMGFLTFFIGLSGEGAVLPLYAIAILLLLLAGAFFVLRSIFARRMRDKGRRGQPG